MTIRRVVSGQNADGKSVIVSDQCVNPVAIGAGGIYPLWGADELPTFPLSGSGPNFSEFFPPLGGYRFIVMVVPPDATSDSHQTIDTMAATDQSALGTGMHEWIEPDNPGMHTTDTVDFEVVLSGEVTIELDDGVTTSLKAGDTFVQNGARHRWSNRGSVPAVVAAFLIGGHSRKKPSP
ncbi:MAG: cupin domain-containing protein [Sphingobium sp.]